MAIMKAIYPIRAYNKETNAIYTANAGVRRIMCKNQIGYVGSQTDMQTMLTTTASYIDTNPAPTAVTAGSAGALNGGGSLLAMADIMNRGIYIKKWSKKYFIRNVSPAVVKFSLIEVRLKNDYVLSYSVAGTQHTNSLLNYMSQSSASHHQQTGSSVGFVSGVTYPSYPTIATYDIDSADIDVATVSEQFKFLTGAMRQDFIVHKVKKYTIMPGQEINYSVKMPTIVWDNAENYLPFARMLGALDYIKVEARKSCTRLVFFDFHGDIGAEYDSATHVFSKPNWKQCSIAVTVKDHFSILPRFLGVQREQIQENVSKTAPTNAYAVYDPEDEPLVN